MAHAAPDTHGPAGRRRRRVRLVVLLAAFFLVTGTVSAAIAKYRGCTRPPTTTGSAVALEIPSGATGQDVVAVLERHGLIRCGGFVGNLLLRGTGKAGQILAGTYDLRVGMTLDQIVTVITTPPPKVPTLRLTVPEGLRISTNYPGERSISSEVAGQTGLSAKAFASLAESGRYGLPPFLPPSAGTTEGFLFPDTYQLVKKGLTADAVIHRMLDQFRAVATEIDLQAGARKLGLTPYQVVIVASMIEREAQVEQDRPKIASVIYNRLARGWTLGIDATLLYDDPTPDGALESPAGQRCADDVDGRAEDDVDALRPGLSAERGGELLDEAWIPRGAERHRTGQRRGWIGRVETTAAHTRGTVGQDHRPEADGVFAIKHPRVGAREETDLLFQVEARHQARVVAGNANGGACHSNELLVCRVWKDRPARCRPDRTLTCRSLGGDGLELHEDVRHLRVAR